MTQRHKHADLIIAWANGAKIQCKKSGSETWDDEKNPTWVDHFEYRIKPEPQPDVVQYCVIYTYRAGNLFDHPDTVMANSNHPRARGAIALTFDGKTGSIKSVAVLK